MGIQDRDYYRKEGPGILDALVPAGLVCRWLIGINVGVFLLQLIAEASARATQEDFHAAGWVTDWFILDVRAVWHGEVWRLLTYAFLHSTDGFFLHLVFNMLFLWWFGSDLEHHYGGREFLAFYLVAAFLGGVAFEAWHLALGNFPRALGASGAVTAVLVLSAFHYPRRLIYVFLFLPVPIWAFAAFNVAKDAYQAYWETQGISSGVAVIVHLAGAAFATAYFKLQWSITRTFRGVAWWRRSRSRPRLKLFEPEVDRKEPVAVSANPLSFSTMDEHLEAKCDALLEKIKKSGRQSLTPEEEAILKQASDMYKKRRT